MSNLSESQRYNQILIRVQGWKNGGICNAGLESTQQLFMKMKWWIVWKLWSQGIQRSYWTLALGLFTLGLDPPQTFIVFLDSSPERKDHPLLSTKITFHFGSLLTRCFLHLLMQTASHKCFLSKYVECIQKFHFSESLVSISRSIHDGLSMPVFTGWKTTSRSCSRWVVWPGRQMELF